LKLKKYLLTAFLQICWLIGIAQSTGSIKGKVLSADNVPVEAAHVQLKGASMVTATDSHGVFMFENVPNGQYKLLVTAIGFQNAEKTSGCKPGKQLLFILHCTNQTILYRKWWLPVR
jgi:hypothetical protein